MTKYEGIGAACRAAAIAGLLFVIAASSAHAADKTADKAEKLTFEKHILPIFRKRCLRCHAGAKPKAGLDLSRRNALIVGGDSGAAIRIRAAESSLLWEKLASNEMPAAGPPLSDAEKGRIRTWINEGAASSLSGTIRVGGDEDVTDAGDHWAFTPPVRPPLPRPHNAADARNPIDAFILSALEKQGLTLAPAASRQQLIRRATFDLLGLPPSPQEVDRFLADRRPGAYERLIDRLLANPHYGERWGRHWLDVAGYADSAGILYEDRPLPFTFRYRDYVIAAMNKDKPYDRFLQEQIAGDELTDYWRAYETAERLPEPVVEGVIATGFLRLAADPSRPDFNTIKNAAAQYYYPTINDTLQILSTATMGLSVQCARCHSHKYDPIPQTEFYRLQAILMPALRPDQWIPQMRRRILIATAAQKKVGDARNKEVDQKVAAAQKERADLRASFADKILTEGLQKLPVTIRADVAAALKTPVKKRNEIQKYLASRFGSLRPAKKELEKQLAADSEFGKRAKQIEQRIAAEQRRRVYFDEIRALYDLPGKVETPLLLRGDPLTPGPLVQPGVLSALTTQQPFDWSPPAEGSKTSGRRLAFARWLTQPGHPLTARVMVNRIWLHHFGEGLVRTPEDFGVAGDMPSHPELLDWLAVEFVQQKWSIKKLHRLILTSAAYRQGSQVDAATRRTAEDKDPENRLLWRQRLRRLEAEPLRDAVLAASGELDRRLFGRAVAMHRQKSGEVTTPGGATGPQSRRRSIYMQVLRLNPLTLLEMFDQPRMETNCLKRPQSTVAMQALTLLNSDRLTLSAERMADRVLRESPGDPAGHAVRIAFGRSCRAEERQLLQAFLAEQTRRHQKTGDAKAKAAGAKEKAGEGKVAADRARRYAVTDLCHMLLNSNEFIYID